MMKLWKMSCIIHPIHLSWYLFNTSLHGDISIDFQNKSYDHPGTMKPPFFTHAETRFLRAQFVRGLASRAFQSFMAQMASAEHLVLPKGHALWRGAPSSTCLHGRVRRTIQPIQPCLVHACHTLSFELEASWWWSLRLGLPKCQISSCWSISQTPQPCPEKVHQDVAKHMVISCRLTISKGMVGKSFFENVPSDSTVLRPAIQRKWTE